MTVGPLGRDDVAALLAESLGKADTEVRDLAELVFAKTGGNPFFVRQFLFALRRKGLIDVAADGSGWGWAIPAIQAQGFTDNVADLVIERIMELPPETQRVVQFAACIGTLFDRDLLARASDLAPDRVEALLQPAIERDVVLHADERPGDGQAPQYRFQHDRVLQAAQGMLDGDQLSAQHARIGQLLLRSTVPSEMDTLLIDITDHLVRGRSHLDDAGRRRLRDCLLSVPCGCIRRLA